MEILATALSTPNGTAPAPDLRASEQLSHDVLTDPLPATYARTDLHNPYVDEDIASCGGCGYVHLQSGRTCVLPHRHRGACGFVSAAEVHAIVAARRAAGGW